MPASPSQTFSYYPAAPPPVNVSLATVGDQPCSYLPGRVSTCRAVWADQIPGGLYHRFMEAGFRRSGKVLYQPACRGVPGLPVDPGARGELSAVQVAAPLPPGKPGPGGQRPRAAPHR